MAPLTTDPRVEAVLRILDELVIHAAQHDIDDAAVRIVEAMDEAAKATAD